LDSGAFPKSGALLGRTDVRPGFRDGPKSGAMNRAPTVITENPGVNFTVGTGED